MENSREKFMKNRLLFCFFFLFAGSSFEACESDAFYPCEKSYVEMDQIQFTQEGIYVQLQNKSVLTSTLHTDSRGLYFVDFKRQGSCPQGKWECQVCHYCNPNYTLYCGICWN